ncbi:GNAT family N-acetyltransferase [Lacinutrix neustonica]|uniref:GNAT family N-acetyltransferase n=1 Tax=Lacinutrix neustonica TaxID=2980107 RepID=A0A9E8SI49_9FLAO|nr:GNAT family N-acetyltransferase [Lacinutrix neustonica]WAC03350.1 GNAT family N-acetyltransferase [Lacinutrix neustonica]
MEYHSDRFQDHSLLVFKADELVAVLPANKVGTLLYSHQGLTYGGLLLGEALKLQDTAQVLKTILVFLSTINITHINIKLSPACYHIKASDEMSFLLHHLKAEKYRCDALSVIDLHEKLLFSKDRISGVKRGQRNGLVVREVQEFSAFWDHILLPNLKLKHQSKPAHTLKEIALLKERFPQQIRQFNVYKDNVVVAGTTIFETKKVAHSQYISGNLDKNTLGSLDFLHVHLITHIFKDKRYFDFGTSHENQGENINEGLLYWKEGFGARTVTMDFYSLPVAKYNNIDRIFI